jgi:hypothetical protein
VGAVYVVHRMVASKLEAAHQPALAAAVDLHSMHSVL